MKIQLIHPPVYINKNGLTALRPSLPLGLAYIAAVLRGDGHEVAVVDALGEAPNQHVVDGDIWRIGLTTDEVVDRIDPEAQAIGVTSMWSYAWPIVRELLHKIRARYPDKPIVCGGEHFTAVPELSMSEAPIDFIVTGEGEETAVALFRALEIGLDTTVIPGIVFRVDTAETAASKEPVSDTPAAEGAPAAERAPAADAVPGIHSNPRRDRIRNIDEIPWPAWDLFDVQAYDDNRLVTGIHYGVTVPILATRGCPYQCTYCSSPNMWTTRWYARPPEDVVSEIQHYVDTYNARNFPFQDLTAILKRDWVVEFAKQILDRKLEITWQLPAGTRSEIIDEEVSRLLVQSGCKSLNLAPESGSERTRKHMKKMLTDEKLFRAARCATKSGLNVGIFLVLGYPTDEPVDMKATAKMCRKLARVGVDDVSAGFFFPLPATEIYRELEKEGKVQLSDEFLKLPIYVHNKFMSPERNYNPHMTAKQMTRWKYWIVAGFYVNTLLFHPGKVFRTLWNFLRGRETSKMESFLQETRRKLSFRKGDRAQQSAQ